jgi:putative hydrolase of the HAD superfamily
MSTLFPHVDTWIFDLDLTLYTPEANIMSQVRDRITLFVQDYFKVSAEEAHGIRYNYWQKYGTTLSGLIVEHDLHPDAYLDFVHDIDLSALHPCADLRTHILALPGRKLIFTNADRPYAERILEARGLSDVFEDIFDIHRMRHVPKPDPASYGALCNELNVKPPMALFIEDSAHNLVPAKALGMTTIWVKHGDEADSDDHRQHIDHQITDVTDWLASVHNYERTP